MKKIIAITLLLAMVLCLSACGDNNKQERFTGTWKCIDSNDNLVATLILNADGTASFVDLTGENAASYKMLWIADSINNITLKWDGEPVVPAPGEEVEVPADENAAPAADVTEEVVADVEAIPEDAAAAGDAATDSTETAKKSDPSVVGFGSLTVAKGQMYLNFAEGSSLDVLLFTYSFLKTSN